MPTNKLIHDINILVQEACRGKADTIKFARIIYNKTRQHWTQDRQLQGVKEIIAYLARRHNIKLCRRTLHYWHNRFALPIKLIGNRIIITTGDLDKWVRDRRGRGKPAGRH